MRGVPGDHRPDGHLARPEPVVLDRGDAGEEHDKTRWDEGYAPGFEPLPVEAKAEFDPLATWAASPPPGQPLDLYALVAGLTAELERLKEWARLCERELIRVETLHENGEATDDVRRHATAIHKAAMGAIEDHMELMTDTSRHVMRLANRLIEATGQPRRKQF